jgi:hypothetical protein
VPRLLLDDLSFPMSVEFAHSSVQLRGHGGCRPRQATAAGSEQGSDVQLQDHTMNT